MPVLIRVSLQIEPDLCGPFSVGTVAIIKLARRHLQLTLDQAADYVNRCVFGGETVEIPAPSAEAAARFVASTEASAAALRVRARVVFRALPDPSDSA
jgi:hypothetical protein